MNHNKSRILRVILELADFVPIPKLLKQVSFPYFTNFKAPRVELSSKSGKGTPLLPFSKKPELYIENPELYLENPESCLKIEMATWLA